MEDLFNQREKSTYQNKIGIISGELKAYRLRASDDRTNNFKGNDNKDFLLGRLEQALSDLNEFYDSGKKQWFRIYDDILKNYRFEPALRDFWTTVSERFDSIWKDLSRSEKFFIRMGTYQFRLSNLNNKSCSSFAEHVKKDFGEQLKSKNPDNILELDQIADTLGIRVRAICLPVMYKIICTEKMIEVTIDNNARNEIKPEITEMLFYFILDFLDI